MKRSQWLFVALAAVGVTGFVATSYSTDITDYYRKAYISMMGVSSPGQVGTCSARSGGCCAAKSGMKLAMGSFGCCRAGEMFTRSVDLDAAPESNRSSTLAVLAACGTAIQQSFLNLALGQPKESGKKIPAKLVSQEVKGSGGSCCSAGKCCGGGECPAKTANEPKQAQIAVPHDGKLASETR